MTDIDLNAFCLLGSKNSTICSRPFSLNGRTYSTNGHMAICVDGTHADPPDEEVGIKVAIESVFEAIDADRYRPFDRITGVKPADIKMCRHCAGHSHVVTCDVCDGSGAHECADYRCGCTHDCGSCDGRGVIPCRRHSRPDSQPCEDCNGTGRVPDKRYIDLGAGLALQWRYLNAVQGLPGPIEWSVKPPANDRVWGTVSYDPVGFRGHDWQVIIMPVRSTSNMDIIRHVLTEAPA